MEIGIIINQNREVVSNKNQTAGNSFENKVTSLSITYPDKLKKFNKTIEFETDDGKVFDVIFNDKYTIQSNISKYESVMAQIVFENIETEEVWKSNIFPLNFGKSINGKKKIEDTEQNHTILDTITSEINKIKEEIEKFIIIISVDNSNNYICNKTWDEINEARDLGKKLVLCDNTNFYFLSLYKNQPNNYLEFSNVDANNRIVTTITLKANEVDTQNVKIEVAEVKIPTKLSELTNDNHTVTDANYVHTDNNFTDTNVQKLKEVEAKAQVNKIEKILVNDEEQKIENTSVNITIPTKLSDLENDNNTVEDKNYVHTDNNFTNENVTKLEKISAGAQVNIIEGVEVNGNKVEPINKTVNIEIPDAPEYSIIESDTTEGYAKTYSMTRNGTEVGVKINIPKDLVVSNGSVKIVSEENNPYIGAIIGDKYIDITLNDEAEDHIYIPVKELVDVYTAENGINVSTDNKISVIVNNTAANGLSVTANGIQLALATKTTAGAMSAADKTKLDNIAAEAQVNVIESVSVNGKTVEPGEQKNVNISMPTKLSELTNDNHTVTDVNYVHTDNNFSDTDVEKLKDLNKRVNHLERTTGIVLEVEKKIQDLEGNKITTTDWTRRRDAIGLVAQATHDGTEVENQYDNLPIYKDIISIEVDDDGNILYYCDEEGYNPKSGNNILTILPDMYAARYRETRADGIYEIRGIATQKENKYYHFFNGRTPGRYEGSLDTTTNKLRSISGEIPLHRKNINQFRSYAKKNGDKFGLEDIWTRFLIETLYLVEYADSNSQAILGNGVSVWVGDLKALIAETGVNRIIVATNTTARARLYEGKCISIGSTASWNGSVCYDRKVTSVEDYDDGTITGMAIYFDGEPVDIAIGNVLWGSAQTTGQCDELGMKSGCINNDGEHGVIYRGIENPFGNVWKWIDGINCKAGNDTYVCRDYTKYASDVFDGDYILLGYSKLDTAEGWVKELGYDENIPEIALPVEVGAGSTTGLCDYYYNKNSIYNRVALVGGGFYDGASCGLFSWNFHNGSGDNYWNIGARLLKHQ